MSNIELKTPNLTEIIKSPYTNEMTAFKDSFDQIEVSLCYKSGLMTTSVYYENSPKLEQMQKICPPEIWNISKVDNNGFRWFPSVIGNQDFILHASPLNKDEFKWVLTPFVKVLEHEQYMYMNEETGQPYEYRLAEENAQTFNSDQFFDALLVAQTKSSLVNELVDKIKHIFNI